MTRPLAALALGGMVALSMANGRRDPTFRGTLVGAKTQLLHAGDRIVLPPGVPHLFTGTPGHTLTYLIFKQRR